MTMEENRYGSKEDVPTERQNVRVLEETRDLKKGEQFVIPYFVFLIKLFKKKYRLYRRENAYDAFRNGIFMQGEILVLYDINCAHQLQQCKGSMDKQRIPTSSQL